MMRKEQIYHVTNEELEHMIVNFKGDMNKIAYNGKTVGENYQKIVKHFNVNYVLSYTFKKLILCTLSTT